MIELGAIRMTGPASVLPTRRKVLALASALGFDEVTATRLATAVSETTRRLLQVPGSPALRVGLLGREGRWFLVLEFAGWDQPQRPAFLNDVFDEVQAGAAGILSAVRRIPEGRWSPSEEFLLSQRHRLAQRSREELMVDLEEKNEELRQYNARLEDTVAERTAALTEANAKMRRDLDAAARYVRSLIPPPATEPIRLDWRYVPSADLGGDTFGYHRIDDDHFCLYLLDVTGHGLDSAFLSVTVMNVLRSQSLANTDFRSPGQVLGALNDAFPMEKYGDKMFTVWYGVHRPSTGMLQWSGGGHPDALLIDAAGQVVRLASDGPMMGMIPWPEFETSAVQVPPASRLYLYSDGVHEVHKTDGGMWTFEEFLEFVAKPPAGPGTVLDHLLAHVRLLRGSDQLDDDFSIVEATFS